MNIEHKLTHLSDAKLQLYRRNIREYGCAFISCDECPYSDDKGICHMSYIMHELKRRNISPTAI